MKLFQTTESKIREKLQNDDKGFYCSKCDSTWDIEELAEDYICPGCYSKVEFDPMQYY